MFVSQSKSRKVSPWFVFTTPTPLNLGDSPCQGVRNTSRWIKWVQFPHFYLSNAPPTFIHGSDFRHMRIICTHCYKLERYLLNFTCELSWKFMWLVSPHLWIQDYCYLKRIRHGRHSKFRGNEINTFWEMEFIEPKNPFLSSLKYLQLHFWDYMKHFTFFLNFQ